MLVYGVRRPVYFSVKGPPARSFWSCPQGDTSPDRTWCPKGHGIDSRVFSPETGTQRSQNSASKLSPSVWDMCVLETFLVADPDTTDRITPAPTYLFLFRLGIRKTHFLKVYHTENRNYAKWAYIWAGKFRSGIRTTPVRPHLNPYLQSFFVCNISRCFVRTTFLRTRKTTIYIFCK